MLLALLFVQGTYESVELDGWTLKVESGVTAQAELWAATKRELDRQLYAITRIVPDAPLAHLREVTIWINAASPETKCMAYHPGAAWLRDHKMNPDMAKGVEIGSAANFVSWTYEQPGR